jgi:hypothetical protein
MAPKKGSTPWNKGLNKETDKRVANLSEIMTDIWKVPGRKERQHEATAGDKHYLFGKSQPEEVVEKIRIANSGKNHYNYEQHPSEESRKKMKESHLGKTHDVETRNIISQNSLKMWENQDLHKNMSIRISGSGNPMWQGGTSFAPYCPKFNESKKEEIRNKYNRCCILCGKDECNNITKDRRIIKLTVHHIDYNKLQGCEGHVWKLVPLCLTCHLKTNANRKFWETKISELVK